jgi:shikimate dehydrogenase
MPPKPNRFAVIGNPIDHSLSPGIHQAFAAKTNIELSYEKILGDITNFEQQVRSFFAEGGSGLNVTLPFKTRAFDMAEKASPRAERAKSANVLMLKDGLLYADNTDGIGLVRDLEEHMDFDLKGKKVVILGAGGATRGIIGPLMTAGVSKLTVLNRDEEKRKALAKDFEDSREVLDFLPLADDSLEPPYDLIIHATSAGLKNNTLEIPAKIWQGKPLCYDLSYTNQGNTPFVSQARARNLEAFDGLGMLIEQAKEAFVLWHGVRLDELA